LPQRVVRPQEQPVTGREVQHHQALLALLVDGGGDLGTQENSTKPPP